MKLKQNLGISLIVLIVTIALILILSGAIILSINVSVQNANLSRFANDLANLQDSVKSMYILDNVLPVVNSEEVLTKEDVLNLVSAKNKEAFELEITNNGESENVTFNQISLEKAGADMIQVGSGKNGQDDIYVVSNNSLKVYYLKGQLYRKKMYFSLNSDIASIVKLDNNNKDLSTTSVNTFSGITVSKSTSGYSNSLGLKIIANISEGETLKIGYTGIIEKNLILAEGRTTLLINSITDFNNYLQNDLSLEEIQAFNNLVGSSRCINLTKYKSGNIIGSYKIDISDYDNISPSISIDSIQRHDNFCIINGTTDDNMGIATSGVAQIRYEYLDNMENETVDESYMKSKAKSIKTDENGNFSLKVPISINTLKIASVDKVGNITIKDVNL